MTLNFEPGTLNSNSFFYHSDGNGNVTMLINPSQYIVAKYLYDAFGNVLSAAGSLAQANLYRFSGKEAHLNSGLVYYLYRYYDPNLQRWPNRDPLGDIGSFITLGEGQVRLPRVSFEAWGGANPYDFVGNDAVLYWDYFGFSFWGRVGNGALGCLTGAGSGFLTGLIVGGIGTTVATGGNIIAGGAAGILGGAIGAIGGCLGGAVAGALLPDPAPGKAAKRGVVCGVIAGAIGGGAATWGATAPPTLPPFSNN